MSYAPAPVPCAGCGDPTPYDAGETDEFPSYGEWLATPLGMTYVRTHRRRECVLAARERNAGRKMTPPLSLAERAKRDAEAVR